MKKKEEFIAGAVKKGHTEEHAGDILAFILHFAG